MPGTSLNFFTRLGFGKLKRKLSRKGSKKNRRESNSSEKTGMELKESIYNEPTTPARSHNQTIYVPKITLFPEVMPSCMPQATYGPNNEPLIRQPLSRTHPQQGNRGIMNNLKQKIMRGAEDDHDGLSVTYITERIIAMSFPADGQEATYKFHLKEVNKMLKTKHGDNYLIVNLSERRDDLHKMNPQVLDFGWPTQLAPPLERVCSICKSMDSWLNSDINHVVVIHCKGTQGRTGVILASFMHYCNICASADQALDRFAMKRFYDDKLASLTQPSQRRYVHYFAGLLSGAIKINSNALYLHHILIHGVPNFDTKGGCRPFIKIYQAMQPVFTSGVYNVTDNMQKICISIQPGIPLRGDILIKCYHKKIRSGQREVMWRAQFHTCAISDYSLIFSKSELDDGSIDPRFPENGKVELVFSPREGSLSHDKLTGFKSDVTVPVDEVGDALIRWDSYENFNALLDNNTLEDLKENGLPPGGIRFQNFNVTEFKNELPVEEGLYARVQKRRVETPLQNGSAPLENGSSHTHAPNVESGYSGYRGSELSSSSYSTASRSYNQLSSDTRKSNDQSQLDDILKDLMKDQATLPMVTRNKDGSQTKTWTTTSFGSSGDIPQKITVQRSETTFNQPGFREERVIKTSRTVHEEQKSDRPAYIPKNAFSYTPASAIESSRSFQSLERERVRSPSSGAPTPPIRTHTLPYRSDFDTRSEDMYMYRTVDSRSDSGQPLSWLQQQQTKLKTKQEGKDLHERSMQERRLVAELKGAQSNYRRRAESETDETDFSPLMNGPTSAFPIHRSASVGASDDIWKSRPQYSHASATLRRQNTADQISDARYDGGMNTHTWTQETYYTTNGASRPLSNKPPPSPGMQRSMTPTSAPITPPIRGSSRDYMRQRSTSGSKEWQSTGRPLQRQFSDRSYDRHVTRMTRASAQTPPPISPPQSYSPIPPQFQATTSYQSYQTSSKSENTESKQYPYIPEPRTLSPTHTSPPSNTSPNYQQLVTEVHVHRPGVSSKPTSPDHLETTRTLDELERLLHSSAASISQPSTLQRSSGNSGYSTSEEVNTLKRSFESHQTSHSGQKVIQQPQVQAAIPPREKRFVTEETESIALMPIGPGLQVLEPDNAGIVTVTTTSPRATTPGFPTSPATPPFPVSPRTPYINQAPYSPSSQFSPAFVSAPAHSHDFRRPLQSQVSHQSRFSDHDPLYASIPEDMSGETTGTPTLPRQGVVSQTVQYQQHHNYTQNQPVQVSTLQRDHHHQQQQQQQNFQSQYHTQQQQQQQQQYNYQTQQFHSGGQQHITQNGPATMPSHGSLHVDTSREYSGTLPRSPQSAGSPPSPGSLNIIRSQLTEAHNYSGSALSPGPHSLTGQSSPSVYFGLSRRGSLSSLADSVDTVNTTPRFVKDTSKYWYKANISREEAIQMLKNSPPGSFVVRDSNSFPGAFGLAIKVAQLPPNVQAKSSDPSADLVRHFLIEPHPKE
ncbi:tensin-3-like isoform X3 [Liolophura sinensis]|uniref:tensin-3-like isoform X3 n=1 Tax=Liolophura sinensis TaxID=3198878 RepID=UPI00315959A5